MSPVEIIEHSRMMNRDNIEVSIVCISFNQAAYITQCLESLVSQETDFAFEIIVHDDASTDDTAEIVRSFSKEHPGIVTALLEKENQYSKNVCLAQLIDPFIRGKYVAYCEGDDWWIDSHKLQTQYDYMESHPYAAACVHAARIYNDKKGEFVGYQAPSDVPKDFSTDEIISLVAPFATNSIFHRRDLYLKPDVYSGWGVGDYPRCIWLSTQGLFHYDNAVMSAYRMNACGSWTQHMNASIDFFVETNEKIARGLEEFDRYTNGQYNDVISKKILDYKITNLIRQRDFSSIMNGETKARFVEYPVKKRLAFWLRCKSPKIANFIQRTLNLYG